MIENPSATWQRRSMSQSLRELNVLTEKFGWAAGSISYLGKSTRYPNFQSWVRALERPLMKWQRAANAVCVLEHKGRRGSRRWKYWTRQADRLSLRACLGATSPKLFRKQKIRKGRT